MDYADYQEIIKNDVSQTLGNMGCQPILFIGSGLTKRYCDTPNWSELLKYLSDSCPLEDKGIGYYHQMYPGNFPMIGSLISKLYTEWAWGSGKDMFPSDFFLEGYPSEIYAKYQISQYVKKICSSFDITESPFAGEIEKLKAVRPHSVITTNYDQMLETIFPDYTPVVGQKIIRANFVSYGEIYKIHGCCSEPNSLVFTKEDYDFFVVSKKYLSAKLLTYFAEHPLLFIGYSASDKNIAGILSDIDEILSQGDEVIPNIYLLEWKEDISNQFEKTETIITTGDNKQVRIKCIVANDFSWVFDAFYGGDIATPVDPKMLRKLLANTYRFVRHDFPRRQMQIDYQSLEAACSDTNGLAKLFGVTVLDSPEAIAAQYPYILTQLAYKLGYSHWNHAFKLIKELEDKHNVNFRDSDNIYHINIKTGTSKTSSTRKYSEKMLLLLKQVKEGKDYTIENF